MLSPLSEFSDLCGDVEAFRTMVVNFRCSVRDKSLRSAKLSVSDFLMFEKASELNASHYLLIYSIYSNFSRVDPRTVNVTMTKQQK
jgi:hypothetical protein